MLAIASRLGPYEIVAPLGAGGMGEVYRARDTRLGREVALKVLPELFANDPGRQTRFEREARAVAALSHPNILAIHDYGTHGAVTYAVMELLEGETLRGRLSRGPLSWREAVEVGAAIVDGLAAAHAKGIIHRDLKPDNLFLTADGRVKVRPYSSSSRFKPGADVRSAGRELQVQAVLKGTIQKRGEQVLIDVELIDVQQNRRLWGSRYPGNLAERLTLQQRIAEEVPEQLRLTLTGDQKQALARLATKSLEAHELYVRGRIEWNRRNEAALKRAIDFFEQAVAKDADYALAYAGLADCYAILSLNDMMRPKDAITEAKAAVAKALAKDPKLAEGHTALANIMAFSDWDWAAAERQFQEAIQLRPNYATAHHWYGLLLAALGRHKEAVAEIQQAQRLDPSSLIINGAVARVFNLGRRYDDAIKQYRHTLKMDPTFNFSQRELGMVYAHKGLYTEAIVELQKGLQLVGEDTHTLGQLGYSYARDGQPAQARKLLQQLQDLSARRYVSPYHRALIYVGLGDKDQAFQSLEQAFAERGYWLSFAKVEPSLDDLRADARFAELLRKMRLLE